MGEENTMAQEKCHQKQVATFEKQTLRNHQDTIFSSLYSDPECVLDLYFTLHPEEKRRGITLNQVKLITLENVFLAQKHNDVAFQVGDRLIVLVEHQSTINENMPLRMLFYIAKEYEKIIVSFEKKLYREKRIIIPKPEFYVVYTGKKPWNHNELKLSEAYGVATLEEISLEVKVRVIYEEEMQNMENTLSGYYNFVGFVKDNIINGKIRIDVVENYIHQFTGSELFKKFLEKISAEEVTKMTNYEFNLEVAKEVWREEAMEEGWEEGIENGIRNIMDTMKLSLNQAMDALKIPAEEQPMYAARIRQQ